MLKINGGGQGHNITSRGVSVSLTKLCDTNRFGTYFKYHVKATNNSSASLRCTFSFNLDSVYKASKYFSVKKGESKFVAYIVDKGHTVPLANFRPNIDPKQSTYLSCYK